jgi:hypothetical protein
MKSPIVDDPSYLTTGTSAANEGTLVINSNTNNIPIFFTTPPLAIDGSRVQRLK